MVSAIFVSGPARSSRANLSLEGLVFHSGNTSCHVVKGHVFWAVFGLVVSVLAANLALTTTGWFRVLNWVGATGMLGGGIWHLWRALQNRHSA